MLKYILKRLILLIPVLLGVSIIVFCIMHVFTSDPAATILGEHATTEQIDNLREELGLNKPLHIQYYDYMKNVIKGDLGKSVIDNSSVTKELLKKFPATAELAISAILFATIFGVIIGVISAIRKNSILDYIGMITALVGVSMPIFWLGIMLIILFSVMLGWLPPAGRLSVQMVPPNITGFYILDSIITGNWAMLKDAAAHLVLPTIALGSFSTAIIARMTRSSVLETLEQDYIRTAWAKGLSEKVVVLRHALRNALIPIITVIGLQLGALLGGAVLTENIFSWPGVGKFTVDAILKSDYTKVQGAVLLISFTFVIVNLIVDIIYAFIDPRIKYS